MKALNPGSLRNLFNSFPYFRILVVGDVMIDSYMWGEVSRISPEAPIPILTSTGRENRLGGAANVALNVQALGAVPVLCSVIGEDEQGKLFLKKMQDKGLEISGILQDKERITTRKTRIISKNQQLLRVDEESTHSLSPLLEERFTAHLENILAAQRFDCILIEDYDKGVLTPTTIRQLIGLAEKHALPLLVDPKKRNFHEYQHITLLKPNFKELTEGLRTDLSKKDVQALFEVCKIHQDLAGIPFMLVSLSESGVFISSGKEYHVIPAQVRDIADVSGAGDTLISTAALCYVAGLDLYSLAAVSNIAGGLVCEKAGVVPVNKEELLSECEKLLEKS